MGEQGILQVKVCFEVTVSGVEGTSAVAEEAMEGMNSETRVSFQVEGMEITISELIRMEGVAVKVGQKHDSISSWTLAEKVTRFF